MSDLRGDLPTHLAWLGYGGLLPFIGLLILTVVDPHRAPAWSDALVGYGAVILSDAQAMGQWEHGGGFSVDGSVRIEAADRAGRERLLTGNFRGDP